MLITLSSEANEREVIIVSAEILAKPDRFVFPGSADEPQSVKPIKAHASVLEIMTPLELKGKRITFYHLPPLKIGNIWYRTNSVIEFRIDRESLGNLYPKSDPRHSHKIPYIKNILGDIQAVK